MSNLRFYHDVAMATDAGLKRIVIVRLFIIQKIL